MGCTNPKLPKWFIEAMFLSCGKVCVYTSVAFLLASVTTCHAFQIVVHHRFPLALWVAFCLAIASDCKFLHFVPKFYVYLTTAPGGNYLMSQQRTPKQCLDRRPNLYATLRGSSVYLFCLLAVGSFVDSVNTIVCHAHIAWAQSYKFLMR